MKPILYLVIFFLFIASISNITGQITAPARDFSDTTSYIKSPQDSVFVFKSTNPTIYLQAFDTIKSSFTWTKFNPLSHNFDSIQPAPKDTGTFNSILNISSAGGYRIYISNLTKETFFTAWVFIDSLQLKLEKDTGGNVNRFRYTCDFLDLYYNFSQPNFKYYDLTATKFDSLHWNNQLKMTWTADQPVSVPDASPNDNHTRLHYPSIPYRNTVFTLTASDNSGLSVSDNVKYITIETHAELEGYVKDSKYGTTYDTTKTTKLDSTKNYSSAVKALFYNRSINGKSYIWNLNDTIIPGKSFSFTKHDTSFVDTIYYLPRTNRIKLISVSKEGCLDSVKTTVILAQSQLEFPNVFDPDNNDPKFRTFRPNFNSLVYFKITIFNRWGNKIYEYQGNVNDWPGWEGNAGFGKASPGIYYFIAVPTGFSKLKSPDPAAAYQYKGFFYLFRK